MSIIGWKWMKISAVLHSTWNQAHININIKAHIKLNPKKLYQSDGYSVKELLKVRSWNIKGTIVATIKTINKWQLQWFCCCTMFVKWLCRWPRSSTLPWKATVSTEKAVRWRDDSSVILILNKINYFDDNSNGNLKSNSVNGEGSEVSFDYSVILIFAKMG